MAFFGLKSGSRFWELGGTSPPRYPRSTPGRQELRGEEPVMQGMGMQTSCWGCKLLNKVCERGTINLSIGRIRNGYLFREKWYIKRKGFDVGASPYKHLFSTPPRKQSPCVELWAIWNGFGGPGRLIYRVKLSHKSLCHWLLCFDCILLVRWWCQVRTIIILVMYSETCIKRTPSIKRTVAEVPKFISLIYFKWNLY